MSDIQSLLDKATALGEVIAAHERVKAFLAAQRAVQEDQEASKLLQEYQAQAEHVGKLESGQKPVEVADKQKLAEIEGRLSANAVVSRLVRAQADYTEMMNQVNRALSTALAADPRQS
jgi:cell fate (sporulation/competence/biofilm development) regulator YlbF (YheA/YmcA/DUF963 family)